MRRLLASPYAYLVLPPLFWSTNAVAGRWVAGELPPVALSFWRWLLALAILAPFGLPRLWRNRTAIMLHWRALVPLALFSVTSFNTLLYTALQTTTAVNAALISSATPIVVAALSFLVLGERAGWRQAGGILIALAGVVVVIARGDPRVLLGLQPVPGDLVALAAVGVWSTYTVLLRRLRVPLDPLTLLTVLIVVGVILLLPLYLALHGASTLPFTPTPKALGVMLWVALFPSLGAYVLWNKGVTAAGASTAGYYTYLLPVFTSLMAVAFLGEVFAWYHAAGIVLVFAGIYVTTLWGRRVG